MAENEDKEGWWSQVVYCDLKGACLGFRHSCQFVKALADVTSSKLEVVPDLVME